MTSRSRVNEQHNSALLKRREQISGFNLLPLFGFLLGLFPAVFLLGLQVMHLAMIAWLFLNYKLVSFARAKANVSWTHIAIWQFLVIFALNAIWFAPLPGTPSHFQAVAIETSLLTLLASMTLLFFLSLQAPEKLKAALIKWLPIGLLVTFVGATFLYMSNAQGQRIKMATPNELTPSLWFLILTTVSFTWWPSMSKGQKILRTVLFLMAGLMALYSAARLVMLAWALIGILLTLYSICAVPQIKRHRAILIGSGLAVLTYVCLILVDNSTGGYMQARFRIIFGGDLSYDALFERMIRLRLWSAAWSVIQDAGFWGQGQINERILLQNEMETGRWLRAHQTYLSYLIAGGIPALISGLILQAPTLQFLRRKVIATAFPLFLGLGLVITLNSLTDSVMQSGVSVQIYMVILFFFVHALRAENHPEHPEPTEG